MDTTTSVQDLFQRALKLQQSGHLEDAEKLYNMVLGSRPDHGEAIHLLGLIRFQQADYPQAVALIARAVEIEPGFAAAHYNLGRCYEQIAESEKAIQSYKRSLSLQPNDADCYLGLGNAQLDLLRLEEALGNFERAIALNPKFAEAHNNRGNVLKELKRLDEALASYDRAIALNRKFADAHNNRGNVLKELKRFDEALASYDRAIALNPKFADAHHNRGNLLQELKQLDEALASYDRAVAHKPDYAEAYYNRGNTLGELKRLDEALESYDKAIALKRDYFSALGNQANLLLLMGNFERGLSQFEHRGSRNAVLKYRRYVQPQLLDAKLIKGKTLLIYHELYFGDMIQFCRYAILAEQCGAKVIISVQNKLHDLLSTLSPGIEIIPEKTEPDSFDFHVPLMSLPLAFHTTLESIPAKIPYLHPEAARVSKWGTIIGEHGFKIGICWQGSKLSEDSGRSFPLKEFLRLSQIPNVRLISLQKYDGIEQLEAAGGVKVETLGEEFDSGPQAFLDTAAVMENLDLVITCDTAMAHLAGALARPTWVALKYAPDWRWLVDRDDSPWYPTLRLFRQNEPYHWRSAFEKMELAIKDSLQSHQLGK